MIHAFLILLVESQFESFLKLIIPFWHHTLYYYFSTTQSLISCCLGAVCSCHCILSLGWLEGLVHTNLTTDLATATASTLVAATPPPPPPLLPLPPLPTTVTATAAVATAAHHQDHDLDHDHYRPCHCYHFDSTRCVIFLGDQSSITGVECRERY
jgi:hypothetical protein